MEFLELKADVRKETGKGPARDLRRNGRIPAILYGPKTEATMLSVAISDLELVQKKSKTPQVFVNLSIGESITNRHTMLKELHVDPLSRKCLHADFYEVDLDRKISVMVPIAAVGKSIGVENGGILQIVRHQLEVLCRPLDVPEKIEIDVTRLDMGDSVHVADVQVDEKLHIPHDVNFTVIACLVPKGMTVSAEEGEEEAEAAAEE